MQLCIPDFDYKTFFWILSLVDEFYTTYDIQPGDGMYVAPEDRPVVW